MSFCSNIVNNENGYSYASGYWNVWQNIKEQVYAKTGLNNIFPMCHLYGFYWVEEFSGLTLNDSGSHDVQTRIQFRPNSTDVWSDSEVWRVQMPGSYATWQDYWYQEIQFSGQTWCYTPDALIPNAWRNLRSFGIHANNGKGTGTLGGTLAFVGGEMFWERHQRNYILPPAGWHTVDPASRIMRINADHWNTIGNVGCSFSHDDPPGGESWKSSPHFAIKLDDYGDPIGLCDPAGNDISSVQVPKSDWYQIEYRITWENYGSNGKGIRLWHRTTYPTTSSWITYLPSNHLGILKLSRGGAGRCHYSRRWRQNPAQPKVLSVANVVSTNSYVG